MSEHTFKQFDVELESLRNRVLQMGGLVEQQVRRALEAVYSADERILKEVISADNSVDTLELEIDEACTHIIARRQPTAVDLRMITTVLKMINDLERVGDKAHKIARLALSLHHDSGNALPDIELRPIAETALSMLSKSLDAFARLDLRSASEVIHKDDIVNNGFKGIMREIVTFMMEDPRKISRSLDVMFMAKAIERIGDHSRNIAEYVVYLAKGKTVRHLPIEQIDAEIARSA